MDKGPAKARQYGESIWKIIFLVMAVVSIVAVAAILIFLFAQGFPAIAQIGFLKFIFGTSWVPSADDSVTGITRGSYGILPMILGSVYATIGAVLIGGGIGVLTAIFLAKFCPQKLKKPLTQLINLLAGIPSVVYGFFALNILVPFIGNFSSNGDGSGLLTVSILLGMMILPTVVSLSRTAIEAVDKSYYEAAVALGSTHEQAVFKAVVPAAKSGITASLILGVGRAIGETMAVVMVAGNSVVIPNGLLGSFRTMTGNIVLEMGYADGLHRGALIATGVVLLVLILLINFLFSLVKNSGTKKKKGRRLAGLIREKFRFFKKRCELAPAGESDLKEAFAQTRTGGKIFKTGKFSSYAAAGTGVGFLIFIVLFIMVKGLPHLSGHLLFGDFGDGRTPTILPSVVATVMTVLLTSVIAFPIGIFAAIYLSEYTKKGSKLVKIIRYGVDTLAAIPSIVFALFGAIFFCDILGFGKSILAGCCTVALMVIPTTVCAVEESLRAVPDSFREGSYALGGGKIHTVYKVILPSAMPGILSSVILGVGRMLGESAPFIFTMGGSRQPMPTGYGSYATTLAVLVYDLSRESRYVNEAYGAACVLIVLVLGLNLLATFLSTHLQNKLLGKTKELTAAGTAMI